MAGFNLGGHRASVGWFFFALIGGGIGIWSIRSISSNPWHAAGVATCVVLALALYYMFNDEDAPEEEGDNVYYLGLLFTLISLVLTLWNIFGDSANGASSNEEIRDLLRNFGIALSSTIAGIFGRILVLNFQRTVSGESEFSESPILPSAGAGTGKHERLDQYRLWGIARELKQLGATLAMFHTTVRGYARDTERELRIRSEALQKENAAFREALQRDTETATREIRDQAKNTLNVVGTSLSGAAKEAETLIKKLESIHDAHLRELRESARSFHAGLQRTSKRSLDALGQSLDAVSGQAVSLSQNAIAIQEQIGNEFIRLESKLEGAITAPELLDTKARQILNDHAQVMETSLRNHREALQKEDIAFRETLQQDAETFARDIKARAESTMSAVGDSLDAAAKESKSLPEKFRSAHETCLGELRETARSFHADLHAETKKSLDTLGQDFDAVSGQAVSLARNMAATREQISSEFSRLESALGQVSGALDLLGIRVNQAAKSTTVLESGAGKAAELLNTLAQTTRKIENESLRTREALQALANEAGTHVETLSKRKQSRFWSR